MIHQPAGGFQGQASDIEIQAKEIIKVKRGSMRYTRRHTGQRHSARVEKDMDRDYFMSPQEAMEYGLIDKF